MKKMTFDQWWQSQGETLYKQIFLLKPVALSARGIAAEAWRAAMVIYTPPPLASSAPAPDATMA